MKKKEKKKEYISSLIFFASLKPGEDTWGEKRSNETALAAEVNAIMLRKGFSDWRWEPAVQLPILFDPQAVLIGKWLVYVVFIWFKMAA